MMPEFMRANWHRLSLAIVAIALSVIFHALVHGSL